MKIDEISAGQITVEPNWSDWQPFPNPQRTAIITAPFGPGVYQLRNDDQLVKTGSGKNIAYRMSSLVPKEWGSGSRNNDALRQYVWQHIDDIEYRCVACDSKEEAEILEGQILKSENHIFPR